MINEHEINKIASRVSSGNAPTKTMRRAKARKKILARIDGKSDIYSFKIEIMNKIRSGDFLKIHHYQVGNVLCIVNNIQSELGRLTGYCEVIGYRDMGKLKSIRRPFSMEASVEIADEDFIEEVLGLSRLSTTGALIGTLDNHPKLKVYLDLKKMITQHISILAQTGMGKSYTVGVLLEEVISKNIPVLILDPHSEYITLKMANDVEKEVVGLQPLGLKPKGFGSKVQVFSPDTTLNPNARALSLDMNNIDMDDFINNLPRKLTPAQENTLMMVLSDMNNRLNFDEIIFNLSNEESNSKWGVIRLIEQVKKLKMYSSSPTPLNELVKQGQASIISLKGVDGFVKDTMVTTLLKQLFEARKKEKIPPFLLVIEEAQNFIPEKGQGSVKSSSILKTIAGEGRKFGVGLCVVSQRPAKVDKNILSQCATQIVMKMTNPNDVNPVIKSCEGMDKNSYEAIKRLQKGTALITGVVDMPLTIKIRPRFTKHGGESVEMDFEGGKKK